jgi:hypothetical protein
MTEIRRVFISHTSEFAKYPEEKSFIAAAVAAVIRAECMPCDMEYFTARDEQPAQYCIERVRACEVYVGVIGLRYGSPVRDRPEVSYPELEFEAASQVPQKNRLVFLLDPESSVPVGRFMDVEYGDRQEKFRQQLSKAGVTCKPFRNVHELEKLIYQALMEDVAGARGASRSSEPIKWPLNESPYPGLLSFTEKSAPLFFGRDREVDELVGKMSEPEGRVLIVSGASGSGKSSLVAAGLWQAVISKGRLPGSERWAWCRIQPGDGETPYHSLAWGLKQFFPSISKRVPDLVKALASNQTTIGELLAPHLAQGQELVLFMDQLEELFTQGFTDEDSRNFLVQLIATARHSQSRLRVVATMRSEFVGRLAESEVMRQVLNAGHNYFLGLVSPRNLQYMIEQPAQATGYDFDSGLIDTILRDAAQEPGSLPLVAYCLNQLFEKRAGRTFTVDAYKTIGGVAGAIGTKADQVMKDIDEQVGGAFDTVFAELVHIERERPPTKKRASLVAFKTDKASNQLIDALAGQECRILVRAGEGQGATVEVAHEKLFTAWRRLRDWIDSSGADLRLIDFEEECAARVHEKGNHVSDLWSQKQAEEVQRALKRFKKTPSDQLKGRLYPQQILITELNDASLSHQDRLLIGQKLAEFGDPRPGVGLRQDGLPDIVWIDIPGGQVTLENVDHVFEVKPFRMAKYLVTNAQFGAFLKANDGYRNKEWWRWEKRDEAVEPRYREANSPRDKVSWFEAVAFCRWLSHRTDSTIRLSTEWEWQQAATGGDPTRGYPWPGEWGASRCNSRESQLDRTSAVGMYPRGATQQGVLDMAGNILEWCLNTYNRPESPEPRYIDDSPNVQRVLRGGSWFNYGPEELLVVYRHKFHADERGTIIGFRLAQDIP